MIIQMRVWLTHREEIRRSFPKRMTFGLDCKGIRLIQTNEMRWEHARQYSHWEKGIHRRKQRVAEALHICNGGAALSPDRKPRAMKEMPSANFNLGQLYASGRRRQQLYRKCFTDDRLVLPAEARILQHLLLQSATDQCELHGPRGK